MDGACPSAGEGAHPRGSARSTVRRLCDRPRPSQRHSLRVLTERPRPAGGAGIGARKVHAAKRFRILEQQQAPVQTFGSDLTLVELILEEAAKTTLQAHGPSCMKRPHTEPPGCLLPPALPQVRPAPFDRADRPGQGSALDRSTGVVGPCGLTAVSHDPAHPAPGH